MRSLVFSSLAVAALAALVLAAPINYTVSGQVVYDAKGPTGHFQGTNKAVSGNFALDGSKLSGKVCVDLAQWSSGEALRDNHTRDMFEVSKFAQACLDVLSVEGNPASGSVTLNGNLNLHGKSLPVKVPVTVKMNGNKMQLEGQFDTKVTDWGMSRPSLLGLKVDDAVKVMFRAEASPQ